MVVSLGIFLIHKVGIVGTDEFDTVLLRQFYQHLVGLLLHGECLTVGTDIRVCHLMTLQLQIVVVAPEVLMPLNGFAGTGNVALQDLRRHLTGNTGRTNDQVLVILLQFHPISTRTVIETIDPRITDEFDKVLITVIVLGEYDEMVAAQVLLGLLQALVTTTGHIHLTPEDGFEGFLSSILSLFVHALADVVKFFDAKHVSMISDGHALHTIVYRLVNKSFNT